MKFAHSKDFVVVTTENLSRNLSIAYTGKCSLGRIDCPVSLITRARAALIILENSHQEGVKIVEKKFSRATRRSNFWVHGDKIPKVWD